MTSGPRPFRFAVQSYRSSTGKELRDLARHVESLGYSTLHMSDHYLGPGSVARATGHRAVTFAPVPAIAVAAEATTSLHVGCRMFCVGYHQPVVLATEIASLAELSDNRLEVGLGAGWLSAEYDAMGIDFPPAGERIELLGEFVELLGQFFAGGELDVDGRHVRVHGFEPLPVVSKRPPLMIGGGAPRVLRLAGRTADIVSINFNNRSGAVGADSVATSGPDETRQKLSWVREGAGERYDDIELEIAAYFVAIPGATDTTPDQLAQQIGLTGDELREFPHALVGTTDEICDELERRRQEYGFSYVTVGDRAIDAFAPVVERLSGR